MEWVRRKGVTKSMKIWNEPTVNHISADICLSLFEFMLARGLIFFRSEGDGSECKMSDREGDVFLTEIQGHWYSSSV